VSGGCIYRFQPVLACDMCGASDRAFVVMGRRLNRSQGPWPRARTGITTSVCRCRRCGLVFANPQPVPSSVNAHYDVAPEQYLNYQHLDVDDDHFSQELAWLERLTPITPGMRSLDVGAGVGMSMTVMARRGFETHGLEPSPAFHRYALEKTGISSDRLALASVETADYPTEYFDFINFRAVLEHFYSPAASLARAARWLKPGGLMFAEIPSARWLVSRLANLFYRLTGTDYVCNISPMHAPFHLYEFTVTSFELHGASAGYAVADHRYMVCDTYMPAVLRPLAERYMDATGTGMQLCVWLRKTAPSVA
jgi:2-polyprenyl-3-methyl-5-hydroxy-6-metoxy-1,4-benzoquinol methylase